MNEYYSIWFGNVDFKYLFCFIFNYFYFFLYIYLRFIIISSDIGIFCTQIPRVHLYHLTSDPLIRLKEIYCLDNVQNLINGDLDIGIISLSSVSLYLSTHSLSSLATSTVFVIIKQHT